MEYLKNLGVVATILIIIAICSSPAFTAELTAGEFMIEVAKIRNLPALNAATAKGSLIAAGIDVSGINVNKILTQGDVVAISNASGLRITTSTPEAVFSNKQMGNFISSFGQEMSKGADEQSSRAEKGDTQRADPRAKGKGKKKGLFRSVAQPV